MKFFCFICLLLFSFRSTVFAVKTSEETPAPKRVCLDGTEIRYHYSKVSATNFPKSAQITFEPDKFDSAVVFSNNTSESAPFVLHRSKILLNSNSDLIGNTSQVTCRMVLENGQKMLVDGRKDVSVDSKDLEVDEIKIIKIKTPTSAGTLRMTFRVIQPIVGNKAKMICEMGIESGLYKHLEEFSAEHIYQIISRRLDVCIKPLQKVNLQEARPKVPAKVPTAR